VVEILNSFLAKSPPNREFFELDSAIGPADGGFPIGRMTWSNLILELEILGEEREFVTSITSSCAVHHERKCND
jgi:hypothetical protein